MSANKSTAGGAANASAETQGERLATGPRTPAGKERSKGNATKHGIFSTAVLLKGESREELESLLKGLREDLQPEGELEEVLVNKIVALLWRYRRFLIAEGAEISIGTEFFEWDQESRQAEIAQGILQAEDPGDDYETSNKETSGLIRQIANPVIASTCLEVLKSFQTHIERDGFGDESDFRLLHTLYGTGQHLRRNLFEEYLEWSRTANCSEEERRKHDYASPEECVAGMLKAITAEIGRIVDYGRKCTTVDRVKAKLNRRRLSVPRSPDLDRLLRYEASLERVLDRTLAQLDKRQRIRLGQPVLPAIKVDVSSSVD